MADLSDVEAALASAVASAVFQGAPYSPGAVQATPAGNQVSVFRGWPISDALDAALTAGTSLISIYSQPNSSRDTTRYGAIPVTVSQVPITLSATISGQTVTFGGTCTPGQVVGLIYAGIGYAYRMVSGDTPASVAAAFRALIPGSQ